ncbi:Flp pilus assembly protein CpaB [Alisedimentitalea sp. MJ-SS2]|uniref:Flp pilus assembly protein CpaB n=1 Tax=Aliisedimentitalea sp. MJ-SS2 TaxID=3049795 RepID=UPI00290A8510|nr:Flp pilus assembly protein CpaB [Alisedimentitalea sp. MJ-SS2]MDU8928278.1 Flp pilus assembly protein CpaB [Alisedimentitalea sp. MJ-SS2]
MIISLLVAVILAGLAVYGTQDWLASQRQILTNEAGQSQKEEDAAEKATLVVSNEVLAFGERLTRAKLREIEWSSPIRPDGSFEKIADLIIDESEENARFVLANMTVGEPILSTRVTLPGVRAKLSTQLTPGMKAISIRVNDVLGVAGFVLPGDRVDILLTRGGRGNNYVDVLLQGVKVLAIDQIADDRKDQPSVVRTVTFEVSTQEAQKLVLGANVGTLSLALRNVASTETGPIERVTLTDLSDPEVAEGMNQATAKAEKEKTEATVVVAPDNERLDHLETLLMNMSEGISNRLNSVEEKMQQPEPRVVEVEKVVEIEKIVTPPPAPKPERVTVGVIRNGQRNEYKVKVGEINDLLDAGVEPVQLDGTSTED